MSIVSQRRPAIPAFNNLVLSGLFALLSLGCYFVVPLYLPESPVWILLPVLLAAGTTTLWALIHEAVHGLLVPTSRHNRLLGRGLAILWGSQFRMLRFGHLRHHRLTRDGLEHTEAYDPEQQNVWLARLRHYGYLLGGLYVLELVSCIGVWTPRAWLERLSRRSLAGELAALPNLQRTVDSQLLSTRGLWELRLDGLAVTALLATSFWMYGEFWPLLVLLLYARGLMVSMVDNSFHYGTPEDNSKEAFNFSLPRWLERLILNFNNHRVHHRHPNLPWIALTQRFRTEGEYAEVSFHRGVLRQLRGPIPRHPSPYRKYKRYL